ncbi:DUF6473 family protein [Seohaeicola saemankumensis]|nr:DUF6473 family protein [Seohaeicola saemankumensis]MCA0873977.1 DUF6473 family protein [Seohaeicola saemankumensis]
MSFEGTGTTASGAMPCRYGQSKLRVRGPKRSPEGPYFAVLGGSETYGRFVTRPFADLIETTLGQTCVNLGSINTGLDSVVNDPDILQVAAQADMAVMQLPGAQDMSNRFYRVHPRRNDRFLEPTPLLRSIFRDVDFTEFHFNRHLLDSLQRLSPDRFSTIRRELQNLWLTRMHLLIEALDGRVILLWLRYTDQGPGKADTGPYLVTADMVRSLAGKVEAIVDVPVQEAATTQELDQMDYGPLQAPAAAHSIGPQSHARIARRLCRVLRPSP